MKKTSYLILLILMLVMIVVGCEAEEVEPEDFFPSREKNTWEYEGKGNEYASFIREVLYEDDDRVQIQENNGGTSVATVYTLTDEAVTRVYFEGERYDQTNLLKEPENDNTVIIKAPIKKGTKWKTKDGEREIQSITDTVDTPAGKFTNCLKIAIKTPDSTVYEYYHSGTGLVKREYVAKDMRVSSTLKKYTVQTK